MVHEAKKPRLDPQKTHPEELSTAQDQVTHRKQSSKITLVYANDSFFIHFHNRNKLPIYTDQQLSLQPFHACCLSLESEILDSPSDKAFHPKFTHQLFPNEKLEGFSFAHIHLHYDMASMRSFLFVKTIPDNRILTETVEPEISPPLVSESATDVPLADSTSSLPMKTATSIEDTLKPHLEPSQIESESAFCSQLSSQEPFPLPCNLKNLVLKYQVSNSDEIFLIFEESLSSNPQLLEYHDRIKFLMYLNVDSASYIDTTDERWKIYIIFAQSHISYQDLNSQTFRQTQPRNYGFVGYATIYDFHVPTLALDDRNNKNMFKHSKAIDDNNSLFQNVPHFEIRRRISQVLISPPYQSQGHGSKLLQCIYSRAYKNNSKHIQNAQASQLVKEITVEDPSEGFRILRDLTDLRWAFHKNILNSPKVNSKFMASATDTSNNIDYLKSQVDSKIQELQKELLVTKKQAQRILEVYWYALLKSSADIDDESFLDEQKLKDFRLAVKRRLFVEYEEVFELCTPEERKLKLAEIYDELVEEYSLVLDRYNKASDNNIFPDLV